VILSPTDFRRIVKDQISGKIRPAGAEVFHADGQTDMTKQVLFFAIFANAPKNTDTLWLPLFIFIIIVYADFLCWFCIALY